MALIGFLLLRLAHDANKIMKSPLAFARLIKTNLMQRRAIAELLTPPPPPKPDQPRFEFAPASTRAAAKRRILRAATLKEHHA